MAAEYLGLSQGGGGPPGLEAVGNVDLGKQTGGLARAGVATPAGAKAVRPASPPYRGMPMTLPEKISRVCPHHPTLQTLYSSLNLHHSRSLSSVTQSISPPTLP